jgi:two-component system, chemotaxis family, chemotaxis protein CheY
MAHVLIVDDDPDIRSSMRTVLEEIGDHQAYEASDGLEALEQLRASTRPLVVLLDLLMPRLDGLGVLDAVAKDPALAHRHAYVLVTVSRVATAPDFAERFAMPVRVVAKPFDITTLLDTVADAASYLAEEAQRP